MSKQMLKQSSPYIIVVVVLILFYSLLGYPLLKRKNESEKLLAENLGTLKQIYSSSNFPSDELITAMEKYNMELLDTRNKLIEKLPVAEEISLPENINLPLFFLEELKKAKGRLRTKASEEGVKIPIEDLGLPNTLPSDQKAPKLIKKLYLTENIVNLLVETGISSIDKITLGETISADMYDDIPLSLTVTCDMPSLTKFLFTLENTQEEFFVVRGFSLTSKIESKGVSARTTSSAATEEKGVGMGTEQTKNIQINLELSLIRWKGLQ